ncbi:7TM diverse intracellular signaling domain-containing protein [Fulvivirga sediminis]|uniref:HTH luxR-type domain-containing protein n=1 Tax=Fulvivirga sediminis TaxID=2803949 RepID=A0A937JX55_9BACT|nr:7TM diverse intracellular signaling domain-containing protein [Fulvivirga sediminis]MBL3655163.1 hypothetical protein [Fulvivirga sediminis]
MILRRIALLLFLLFQLDAYAAKQLEGGLYIDSTGAATIDQISHAAFTQVTFPYTLRPQDDKVYWVKLNLREIEDFLVFSDWSFVEFYTADSTGTWTVQKTGHLVPYLERDVPFKNKLLLRVPEHKQAFGYVKLSFSLNSIRIPNGIKPLSVSTPKLISANTSGSYIAPFLQGFLLCIIIFLFFLYSYSREKALIIFITYLLLWVYTISHNSGQLIAVFSYIPNFPAYIPFLDIALGSSIITITAILVMYHLIDFKTHFPHEKLVFDIFMGILGLVPIIAMFTPGKFYLVLADYIVISIVVVGFLYISISAYLKKIPFSLFFLLANLPFFLGTLIYLFFATGFAHITTKYDDLFLFSGVLCQSVFFSIIFSFRYNRMKLKNTQKQMAIAKQNQKLSTMTLHLSRKNTVLEQVKKYSQHSSIESDFKPLLKMIEQDLAFDKNWETFKLHFEQVNQNFFNNLIARHPSLTANDQKLCAYLKLSLSSKEIAQLMHTSLSAVEKARYRLRKKMELDGSQNLSAYIQTF